MVRNNSGNTVRTGGAITIQSGLGNGGGARGDINIWGGDANGGGVNINGGYTSTGVSISSVGNIQTNGTLTVDSASTLKGTVTIGGNGNEFQIIESSDNITLKNTIQDKDISIDINDG